MSSSDRPHDKTVRPAGAAGDGMDTYPTYHDGAARDGAAPASRSSTTKPTDAGLPRARRTYALPMFLGLAAFALLLLIAVVSGGINMAGTSEEAMTPGGAAAPAATAPAATAPATAGTDVPEPEGALDADGQAETMTGPGEVEAGPGAVDVPGGASTTPVAPAPAQ